MYICFIRWGVDATRIKKNNVSDEAGERHLDATTALIVDVLITFKMV